MEPPTTMESFDWSALTHVYGPATDVPALHARLMGGEPAAMRELVAALYHQEDVCDAAAAYALVLGAELARGADARAPEACLEILALFAQALRRFGAPPPATAREALERLRARSPLCGADGSMNTIVAAGAEWAAIQEALDAVAPFFDRPDTRFAAAQLAALLEADAAPLHPAIRRALDPPPANPQEHAALLLALGWTAPTPIDDEVRACLDRGLASSWLPATAAAMGMVLCEPKRVDDHVLDALAEGVGPDLPHFFGYSSAREVATLIPGQAIAFLERVLRCAPRFDEAVIALGALLGSATGRALPWATAFGTSEGRPFVRHGGDAGWAPRDPLPEDERAVWRIALEAEVLWTGDTDLFERLSLPADRDALRALVDAPS